MRALRVCGVCPWLASDRRIGVRAFGSPSRSTPAGEEGDCQKPDCQDDPPDDGDGGQEHAGTGNEHRVGERLVRVERLSLYRQAERRIMQDAPWAPLYYEVETRLVQPNVTGVSNPTISTTAPAAITVPAIVHATIDLVRSLTR